MNDQDKLARLAAGLKHPQQLAEAFAKLPGKIGQLHQAMARTIAAFTVRQ